ncbi:hypothetical protein, partial [uncultured Gilvimarinus sp.]|uniref:hypothetical protein n=1 Tax=uncultured Gilvimarinus sp. TaxID=1689143 RepID=UPI0030ECB087
TYRDVLMSRAQEAQERPILFSLISYYHLLAVRTCLCLGVRVRRFDQTCFWVNEQPPSTPATKPSKAWPF